VSDRRPGVRRSYRLRAAFAALSCSSRHARTRSVQPVAGEYRSAEHPGFGAEGCAEDPRVLRGQSKRALCQHASGGARISSPAAITPPPMTTTSGSKMLTTLTSRSRATRRAPQQRKRVRVAVECQLRHQGPLTSRRLRAPARACWPGCASPTPAPPSSRAVPETSASRQPRLGQPGPQGGPSAQTTMWPARRPLPASHGRAPRRSRSLRRCRSRASASRRLRSPCAAPARCSASSARLPSLSMKTGSPMRSAITSATRRR